MNHDVPEFPPSPRILDLSPPASIPYDEIRTEVRTSPKNNVVGVVRLQVAHHFYYRGEKVVHGNWAEINVGFYKSNYISVYDVDGEVKCRR